MDTGGLTEPVITLLTSATGVVATLLGALLTFYIQRTIEDRNASRQRIERNRQERLDTYSGFTGAAIQYRLSELTRWHRQHENPGSAEAQAAVDEAHRCRAALFEVLSRLQILTDDPGLRSIATRIVEEIDLIHRAGDAEQRRRCAIDAGEGIERFVRFAAADINPGNRGEVVLPFKR